jgi:hypothetical protein
MRKTTEAEMINFVMRWLADEGLSKIPKLQYDFAIHFVGMGHGWVEFDLELWNGKTAFLEAWIDREETELTIGDRERLCEAITENRWRIGSSFKQML